MTAVSSWIKKVSTASSRTFDGCYASPCYGVPFNDEDPRDTAVVLANAGYLAQADMRPQHLPIINARDGREYRVGESFPDPNVEYMQDVPVRLLDVDDRFFSARALVQPPGRESQWVPLQVRFTHPRYLGRRVAFLLT